MAMSSRPSENLTPVIICGNWFSHQGNTVIMSKKMTLNIKALITLLEPAWRQALCGEVEVQCFET